MVDGVKHGYVFEVDPVRGGDPTPITGLGRFEHEAVAFDGAGTGYLTEDADTPFGQIYRYRPHRARRGRGSLHAGGSLATLRIPDLDGTDLSAVTEPGTVFGHLEWVPVADPDPASGESLRDLHPGTPIQKAEGIWYGEGAIWFVSSYGGGPDAEDEEDRSAAAHGGQIWRYQPRRDRLELVVQFAPADDFEGPDNITVVAPRLRRDVHRRRRRPTVRGGHHRGRRHVPLGPEPDERRGVRRRLLLARRRDAVRQRPGARHDLRHLGAVARPLTGVGRDRTRARRPA